MSGNSALFDHLNDRATAWQLHYGTQCGPEAAKSLLVQFLRQVVDAGYPGEDQPDYVVALTIEKIAKRKSKGGWGFFRFGGRILRGGGVRPRGEPRPHLCKDSYAPAHDAAWIARDELQREGVERPTLKQIVEKATSAAVRVTIGHVQDLFETPSTKAAIDALPGRLPDLCRNLQRALPVNRLHVIELDDVAAGMATPSSCAATIRTHRRRAAEALKRIGEERFGLNVAIVGKLAVVGRRRKLPDDVAAFVANTPVRRLDPNRLSQSHDFAHDAEKSAAEKARIVADQLVGFLAAWIEHGPHVLDVSGDTHLLPSAAGDQPDRDEAFDDLPEVERDRHWALWAMRNLDRRVGYWTRSHRITNFRDDDISWALGVAPRSRFDPKWNGADQASPEAVEHHEAFNELRIRYGQGQDLGSLYRYCYERGGLSMTAAARKVAVALDGVRDLSHRVVPQAGTPGRRRVHPSAKPKPIPPKPYVPWQTVPEPKPVTQAMLDSVKVIPPSLLPKVSIVERVREYLPCGTPLPWFLCGE